MGKSELTIQNTKIYRYLSEKTVSEHTLIGNIDRLSSSVNNYLNRIVNIFPNYTLHDMGHSVRVIEHMTMLLNDDLSVYSDLHLAMILLVGMLHDIGMIVSADEYKRIRNDIETDYSQYSEDEITELAKDYFRERHAERVCDAIDNFEVSPNVCICDLLRYDDNISYAQLVADICQSHGETVDWIVSKFKSKKRIGNEEINPQHIAFLLRIGDALDIDGRRVPWGLYKLLKLKGYSKEEWEKSVVVENYDKISRDENGLYTVSFEGTCSDRKMYIRLKEYFALIERDFNKINEYSAKFERKFRFIIKCPFDNMIETKGFIAPEHQFELNYKNVAPLLMGENLYGDKKHGLRELLQNAIDAVMLMKEIAKSNAYVNYEPKIFIELNKQKNTVMIIDNGIGMSEDIIDGYFFNIGKSYYGSKDFKEKKLKYKPIGKYGIGFLACFMLSHEVKVETKTIQRDMMCYEFDRDSEYAFRMESREQMLDGHGTRITLNYDEFIGQVFKDKDELVSYINETFFVDGYSIFIINEGEKEVIVPKTKLSDAKFAYKDESICVSFDAIMPEFIKECVQLVTDNKSTPSIFFMTKMDGDDECYFYRRIDDLITEEAEQRLGAGLYNEDGNRVGIGKNLRNDLLRVDKDIENDREDVSKELINQGEITYANEIIKILYTKYGPVTDDYYDYVQACMLAECYWENSLHWIKVPYLSDNSDLNSFLQKKMDEGYEAAEREFEARFNYFYVFGTKRIDDNYKLEMVEESLSFNGQNANYNKFTKYPFRERYMMRSVFTGSIKDIYIPIARSVPVSRVKTQIFKKGVLLHNEELVLPIMIYGTKINKLAINLISDEFDITVSRDMLEDESRMKLASKILKIIYDKLTDNNMIPEEDKIVLAEFEEKIEEAIVLNAVISH